MNTLVVALGGNALQRSGMPADADSQLAVVRKTAAQLLHILKTGRPMAVVHGNGPQVGRIVLQNEAAAAVTPPMPFDVCGAMSQGMIGYHI
ncbi:MAG: carbamate kinase, partial [Clostridiales bacterium]|nr:carbamate kinase [Clostridiales bacterium]